MAPRAPLTRRATTSPTRPASPNTGPTHLSAVPVAGRSVVPPAGTSWTGAVDGAAPRSTWTSTEAMPRTSDPGVLPQATTDIVVLSDRTAAASNLRANSTLVDGGS